MGRRSRKRSTGEGATAERGATTRAERDEARRRRAQELARSQGGRHGRGDPRLPAPWGPFPLTELVVLLAIGLLIGAFIVRGERGRTMLAAGLLLGSLGGLEVSIVGPVPVPGWLNRLHEGLRMARGFESHGQTALEAVMAVSAAVAVVGFVVWFFVFSGSSPVPLNLSY